MQTNKFRHYKALALLLGCFLSAYFITSIVVFPNNIKLIEGEKQYFNFKLPIKAIIEPETVSVLKINNEEVTNNYELNLYKNNEVYSENTGTAQMTLSAFGVDIKQVSLDFLPSNEIVPCGATIGVQIKSEGIMVLGTGYVNSYDNQVVKPAEGVLKPGDVITKINDKEILSRIDFKDTIENSEGILYLNVLRDEEKVDIELLPVISKEDQKRKIGIWIRDGTRGIGTITYYNPDDLSFGALGHGIVDVDTKKLMNIKEGKMYKTIITNIKEGKRGTPGELVGDIISSEMIGNIDLNSELGIYGVVNSEDIYYLPQDKMKIALQSEIVEGPATIRSNINGEQIEEFDIYIESVNRFSKDESKGMVIKITDPDLIDKTGGIVQGMSGSPIIQNNKVVGAVTHVFVQDPTKGYGIFIENMLRKHF